MHAHAHTHTHTRTPFASSTITEPARQGPDAGRPHRLGDHAHDARGAAAQRPGDDARAVCAAAGSLLHAAAAGAAPAMPDVCCQRGCEHSIAKMQPVNLRCTNLLTQLPHTGDRRADGLYAAHAVPGAPHGRPCQVSQVLYTLLQVFVILELESCKSALFRLGDVVPRQSCARCSWRSPWATLSSA